MVFKQMGQTLIAAFGLGHHCLPKYPFNSFQYTKGFIRPISNTPAMYGCLPAEERYLFERKTGSNKRNLHSVYFSTKVPAVSTSPQPQLSYHIFPWVWQLKLLLLLALQIPLILCCSTQSLSINRKHVGF